MGLAWRSLDSSDIIIIRQKNYTLTEVPNAFIQPCTVVIVHPAVPKKKPATLQSRHTMAEISQAPDTPVSLVAVLTWGNPMTVE